MIHNLVRTSVYYYAIVTFFAHSNILILLLATSTLLLLLIFFLKRSCSFEAIYIRVKFLSQIKKKSCHLAQLWKLYSCQSCFVDSAMALLCPWYLVVGFIVYIIFPLVLSPNASFVSSLCFSYESDFPRYSLSCLCCLK